MIEASYGGDFELVMEKKRNGTTSNIFTANTKTGLSFKSINME